MWVLYTVITTLLLSLSAVFLKCGIKRADSSVTTALRTLIVVIFTWVFIFSNNIDVYIPAVGSTSFLYLILAGIALFCTLLCLHISQKFGTVTGVSALERLTAVLLMAAAVINKQTSSYYISIICMVLIAVGIILVVTKKTRSGGVKWLLYGILSSLAAFAAYILSDKNSATDSTVSLALMLTVVLVISLIAVFIRGLQRGISRIPVSEFMFIILSGITAGLAWLCFRAAYYSGSHDTVIAVTSMSVAVSAALAALFLKEKVSWKAVCGLLLIITGTLMYVFMI